MEQSTKFTFFWKQYEENGIFSNWSSYGFKDGKRSFPSGEVADENEVFFKTSEHYLMYQKACLFEDQRTAELILKADGPLSVKHLGRQVKNFDPETWDNNKEEIMYRALKLKTEQNPEVKEALLATGTSIMAEASPYDKIWGIGVTKDHKDAKRPETWKGQNLLGRTWTRVRNELFTSS